MKNSLQKLFTGVFSIIAVSALSILLSSCSCSNKAQSESKVPADILKKSNEYIAAATGQQFFDKYITPNFDKTRYIKPNYFMVYKFEMPDKPYVNGEIRFTLDSTGHILDNKEIVGIPNCAADPGSCEFSVNEEQAKTIAGQNGLEKGIKDWDANFVWNAKYNQYVWEILSTKSETNVGDHTRGSGQKILIDPNSGKVLALNEWKIN